jgi:type II secretory pathway pseudopilin PulG
MLGCDERSFMIHTRQSGTPNGSIDGPGSSPQIQGGSVRELRIGRNPGRRSTDPERGIVLLAVLFMVALILIALAVAAPQMAKSIQRDKELELLHRGNQYKRAIKLYYRKYGSYPASIDQLMNTNQIRFLRKRYTDPMTGKDDWKPVYFGQVHVPALGLFGQVLIGGAPGTGIAGASGVGTPIGGSGSTNGFGASGTTGGTSSGTTSGFGSSSSSFGLGSSGSGSSSFGSGSSGFGSSSSGFGSSGSSGLGSQSTTGSAFGSSTGSTDSGGSSFGSSSSGFGSSTATGANGSATGSGTGSGSGTGFGASSSTNSTLGGGGPIVGVVIPDTHASIKEYKKQKHYNEWEFVYNPLEDQLQGAGVAGQQPLNGASGATTGSTGVNGFGGTNSLGGSNGFGSSSGSNGFGSSSSGSSGFGSSSSSGTGSSPSGNQPNSNPQQ